jgi:hypothetical protein
MGVMDKIMGVMMGRMSKGEKEEMMGKMMEKFFTDMTAEDKQKMMGEMMPKMMMGMMSEGEGEGEMMSKMMGGDQGTGMPMMLQMMMSMMPQCLKIMLPDMPKEKRIDFVLEIVASLMEHGCTGMSDNEKKDFAAKMIDKVNA